MKHFLIIIVFLTFFSCKKANEEVSTSGDEVSGTYTGFYGSQSARVQVYKTSNQTYAIRKLDPAPFPEFTFQYQLDLFGAIAYTVPVQTVGSITIRDSSSASYFSSQRNFGFTIRDFNSGSKWMYSGYK